MTRSQLEILNLGIPINDETCLVVESGLQWVLHNTTLDFDIQNMEELETMPARVRLFLLKYHDLMSLRVGVSSESIEGLSQSFSGADKASMLWDIASSLLDEWLVSPVKFVSAKNRWA